MKLALLLNVVDPSIGGVLIMGDRGTGKSVAVRALQDLLPQIDVVVDDPFNSHPTGRYTRQRRCFCVCLRGRCGLGLCAAPDICCGGRPHRWLGAADLSGRQQECAVLPRPCCRCELRLLTPPRSRACRPADTKLMGPGALQSYLKGEKLAATKMRTPLVELPLGATGAAGGFLSTGGAALADVLATVLTLSKHPRTPTQTPNTRSPVEDRICGTIDIEKALSEGVKAYEPGLLAKANRGILYVDEVNLLDDGLVDVVLDSGGCS